MNVNTLPGSPTRKGGRLHNGEDEERYIEGQVLVEKGSDIGGVYDQPEDIGFLGYLNTKLPEKNRKEQMDHFRDQAKELMEIRRSSRNDGS